MTYATIPISGRESSLATDARQAPHLGQNKRCPYPVRCLVIDDNKTILNFVVHMLTMLGFDGVETAQKQPEAMHKLTAGPYELMITDLEMPDMNGYRLTRTIKKAARDTKTIIMTDLHEDDCREMMASWWVDGWLFKPFDLKELRSMLSLLGVVKASPPQVPRHISWRKITQS